MTRAVHPWEIFGGRRSGPDDRAGRDPGRAQWARRTVANLEDAQADAELRHRLTRVIRSSLGAELVTELVRSALEQIGHELTRYHLLVTRGDEPRYRVHPVSALEGGGLDSLADAIYERISGDIIELIDTAPRGRGRAAKNR